MNRAERARQIDREEFEAECAAIRKRALAKLSSKPVRDPRVESWIKRTEQDDATSAWGRAAKDRAKKYPAFGEERTLREWSLEKGVNTSTIRRRLEKGWTLEDALTLPSSPGTRPPGYIKTSKSTKGTGGGRDVRDLQTNLEKSP